MCAFENSPCSHLYHFAEGHLLGLLESADMSEKKEVSSFICNFDGSSSMGKSGKAHTAKHQKVCPSQCFTVLTLFLRVC